MRNKTISKYLVFLLSLTMIMFLSACGDDEIEIGITGAQDFELAVGSSVPDLTEGIGVSGIVLEDLGASLDVDYSTLNPHVIGDYEVTYTFTDPAGNVYSQTITVSVVDGAVGNVPHIFGVEDISYVIGEDMPNFLDGVTADDSKFGDLTFVIDVDLSLVDFEVAGNYIISYHVQNEDGYHYTTNANIGVTYGEELGELPEEFFIVEASGLYGVIDMNGETVIPTEYLSIQYYGDNMVRLVKQEDTDEEFDPYVTRVSIFSSEILFYNFDNDSYIKLDYYEIGYFNDGLARVMNQNYKYGYVNKGGEVVIPLVYDGAYNFDNGYAETKFGNNRGVIDTEGNTVIDFIYSNISKVNDNYFMVQTLSDSYVVNLNNEIVYELSDNEWSHHEIEDEHYYMFRVDGLAGLVDEDMNIVSDFKYINLYETDNGYPGFFRGFVDGAQDFFNILTDFMMEDYKSHGYEDNYMYIGNDEYSVIIDLDTNETIITTNYKYTSFYNIDTELFKVVNDEGMTGIINRDGDILFDFEADYIYRLYNDNTKYRVGEGTYGLINEDGIKITIELYSEINSFVEGKSVVVDLDGYYGYINIDGSIHVTPQFHYAYDYTNGFAEVITGYDTNENALKIFIDSTGEFVSEYRYADVRDFHNGYAAVAVYNYEMDLLWGFINEAGVKVVDTIYYQVEDFNNGYAIVSDVNLSGMIDTTGSIVVPIDYEEIRNFSSGLAAVQLNDDTWGYVNTSGVLVIDRGFYEGGDFASGLAPVKKYNTEGGADWVYINASGLKAINEEYFDAGSFNDGLAYVQLSYDGDYGYINNLGELAIEDTYFDAYNFREGFAKAGGSIINTDGDSIFTYGYRLYETDYGFYSYNPYIENYQVYIYIEDGELTIPYTVNNGDEYITFISGTKWGVMDTEGTVLIDPIYDFVEYSPYYDVWVIYNNELKGIAELDGTVIAQPNYDQVFYNDDFELLRVNYNDNEGVINIDGTETIRPIFDDVCLCLEDDYIIVRLGDTYGVYSLEGEIIINIMYDSIYHIDVNDSVNK